MTELPSTTTRPQPRSTGRSAEAAPEAATERAERYPPEAWNATARPYPDTPLHELFERQAARTPDATALRFRHETLTYAALDATADRLASELVAHGAGPGAIVAVCMERSLEMVVAIHAVLKAGAAYLPVDPDDPPERVAFMLEDAGAPVMLTQRRTGALDVGAAHRIIVDESPDRAEAGRPPRRPVRVGPDDLAYVIYTSGSTGQPKGAMISHRAITNRLHWMQEAFELTPADRVLQKTPFSFDVSVWELFWPLLVGAELVIAEPGGHRDSGYLSQIIVEQGITTIHFVPSMLRLFLDDPMASECTSLQRVICSGEALPRSLQDRFYERLDAELHNLYGPTEAAVDVTAWACDRESELPFVPIGRPIANTRTHILDEDLRPVPVGVAGELHIGGVQVARGYLGRPALTAERFIADPFSDLDGARLYKTGDLARYLPDGSIEFLGRSDTQVKIRGFRVELGEIEAVLGSARGVRGAVVVARGREGTRQEPGSGEQELVAYVSHDAGDRLPLGELRSDLASRLPAYMIPTIFVPVERFPLTSNGKIDRSALPDPPPRRRDTGVPDVPPRTPLERLVADRWCAILGLQRVGVHDRFFELGGSSLQAARFVNELRSELGESIFVVTLFSAPTVAEYAAFLQADYPEAVARLVGGPAAPSDAVGMPAPVTGGDIARFRQIVPTSSATTRDREPTNPPAIFILSPPRSGTSLLRIMLAGHPDLFAASELQLLGFSTLQERLEAYAGPSSGWLDGTVRALMQIDGVGADEARDRMGAAEAEGLTTAAFYLRLQRAVAPRILVDKSPSYALDPAVLDRAERIFVRPMYIHLVRDPVQVIESYERHHMEQVSHLRPHRFTSRQLAEMTWTVSHRNIIDFLATVPEDRWVRLSLEALVRDPVAQMRVLCERLGLAYDEAVLRPYDQLETKMVDGVHPESAPMDDPGFLAHGRIDPSAAVVDDDGTDASWLGRPTRELAARLGYERYAVAPPVRPSRRGRLGRQRGLRQAARGPRA